MLLEEVEIEAEAAAPILAGNVWMLHVDGASDMGGFGAKMILASPDDIIVEQALCFNFRTSNNEVEYETLVAGLRWHRSLGYSASKPLVTSNWLARFARNFQDGKLPGGPPSRLEIAEYPEIYKGVYVENLEKPRIEGELVSMILVDREPC